MKRSLNICSLCGIALKRLDTRCVCGGVSTGEFPVNPDGSLDFEYLRRFAGSTLEILQRLRMVTK